MTDAPNTPTVADLYARYDEIAAVNLPLASRFALEHRLFDHPRPTARPDQPPPAKDEDPRLAEYRELAKTNPIVAARRLLQK